MSLMPVVLIASAMFAQPHGGPPPPPPVSISVVAVHATSEGGAKQFDPGLEGVRHTLDETGFDRYRKLSAATISAPLEQESSIDLGSGYALLITPLSRERNGHVRMHIRLRMDRKPPRGQSLNAVDTTIAIGPGKQFVLRGLKMDRGELIVVMSLGKA